MCKACSIIHCSLFSYITPNGVRFARKMYIYIRTRARGEQYFFLMLHAPTLPRKGVRLARDNFFNQLNTYLSPQSLALSGKEMPSEMLLLARLRGMPCLLSLPKKRSVPTKMLKCLAWRLPTKPPVTPVLVKPRLNDASNHLAGATLAENVPEWYE